MAEKQEAVVEKFIAIEWRVGEMAGVGCPDHGRARPDRSGLRARSLGGHEQAGKAGRVKWSRNADGDGYAPETFTKERGRTADRDAGISTAQAFRHRLVTCG